MRPERRIECAAVRCLAGLVLLERRDQDAAHAEHGVGVEVLVALDEHVRDQRLIALGGDHEVDVRGAHRAAPAGLEQVAHRAVGGDRVGLRLDRPEPEAAVVVGEQVRAARAARRRCWTS